MTHPFLLVSTPARWLRVAGALVALVAAVLVSPVQASAQARRGPLVVLGLRAPQGDDEAATNVSIALRQAARGLGFDAPLDSPALELLIATLGCDDSVPIGCLDLIANNVHAQRMLVGTVRRAGRGREVPLRVEVRLFDVSTREASLPQTVEIARPLTQDNDALLPFARTLLNGLLPPPAPVLAPTPPTPAPTPVTPPPVTPAPVTPTVTPSTPSTPATPPATATPGTEPATPATAGTPGRRPRRRPGTEAPPAVAPPEPAPAPSTPALRWAGGALIGVGGALAIVGVAYGIQWLGWSAQQQTPSSEWAQYQPFPAGDTSTRNATAVCNAARAGQINSADYGGQATTPDLANILSICNQHGFFQRMQWGFIGAGGALVVAGAIMLIVDPHRTATAAPAPGGVTRRRTPIQWSGAPTFAPGYAGIDVGLRF